MMPADANDIDIRARDIRARLEAALVQAPETVAAAYLFGSRGRGESTGRSDVDIAILMQTSEKARLLGPQSRLSSSLERELGLTVDLVDLRTAPPDVVHRILRDGHLLIDRDPRVRVEFEVQARNQYFDVLPHLERYRRYRAA